MNEQLLRSGRDSPILNGHSGMQVGLTAEQLHLTTCRRSLWRQLRGLADVASDGGISHGTCIAIVFRWRNKKYEESQPSWSKKLVAQRASKMRGSLHGWPRKRKSMLADEAQFAKISTARCRGLCKIGQRFPSITSSLLAACRRQSASWFFFFMFINLILVWSHLFRLFVIIISFCKLFVDNVVLLIYIFSFFAAPR